MDVESVTGEPEHLTVRLTLCGRSELSFGEPSYLTPCNARDERAIIVCEIIILHRIVGKRGELMMTMMIWMVRSGGGEESR